MGRNSASGQPHSIVHVHASGLVLETTSIRDLDHALSSQPHEYNLVRSFATFTNLETPYSFCPPIKGPFPFRGPGLVVHSGSEKQRLRHDMSHIQWRMETSGVERGKKRSRSLPEIERGVDRATTWTHEILGMNRHLRDGGPRDVLRAAEAECQAVPTRN